jgi:hypothetical protein
MGIEPNARRRLQLQWVTTSDPLLRSELRTALEATRMSFDPSAELRRQIAACPVCDSSEIDRGLRRERLCESHRARWNLELCLADQSHADAEDVLDGIMDGVLSSERSSRAILAALDRQLRALHMVWEAHERGAIRLPERIAESVRVARLNVPVGVGGIAEPSRRIQQAS